jgi:hypothetical protein
MKKLNSVDTISIKNSNGLPTIRINGSKATPYDINGVSFLANEIEAVPVNDLGYFNPIVVEFDETCTKAAKLNHISDHIVASLSIMDDSLVDAFITFMDPANIIEMEAHEAFQMALEQVVAEDSRLDLYAPVRMPLSKAKKKELQKLKDESAGSSSIFDFSEVGCVQFTVLLEAETFNDAFIALDKVIANLEKKARKLMKQN